MAPISVGGFSLGLLSLGGLAVGGVAAGVWPLFGGLAIGWQAFNGCFAIAWLAPCRGCFRAAFTLGDKVMRAARQARLPRRIVKALVAAPKYPEGTGLRLEVESARDIGVLKRLAAIKLVN